MSKRVTREVLASALENLKTAAVKVGIDEASRWHLEIGSKTYGRAYRLWLAHEDYEAGMRGELQDWHSGHYTPIVRDFLGMTASEALHTMNTLRDAFLAVRWAQS